MRLSCRIQLSLIFAFTCGHAVLAQGSSWIINADQPTFNTNSNSYDINLNFSIEQPQLEVQNSNIDFNSYVPETYPLNIIDSIGATIAYSQGNKIILTQNPEISLDLPFTRSARFGGQPRNDDLKYRAFTYNYSPSILGKTADVYCFIVSEIIEKIQDSNGLKRLYESNRYKVVLRCNSTKLELLNFQYIKQLSFDQPDTRNYGFPPSEFIDARIAKNELNKYWFICNFKDSLAVFSLDQNFNVLVNSKYKWLLSANHGMAGSGNGARAQTKFSFLGNFILATGSNNDTNYQKTVGSLLVQNACAIVPFDRATGTVHMDSFLYIFESDKIVNSSDGFYKYARYFTSAVCSSPNDSFVYFLLYETIMGSSFSYFLVQYDVYSKVSVHLPLKKPRYLHDFKIGPNGKLYMLPQFGNIPMEWINHPNIRGKECGISDNSIRLDHQLNMSISRQSFWPLTSMPYPLLRLGHRALCSGQNAEFYALTDTNHWKQYTLFLPNGDSVNFSNDDLLYPAFKPGVRVYLDSSGIFEIKLRGETETGYIAWYSDSIQIHRNPEASFKMKDTVGCQWIAYDFENSSSANYQGTKISWNWDFGDGSDSIILQNGTSKPGGLSHVYTKSGLYTVSLIVNDSFCADTFTMISQVEILSAPRPGILVEDSVICAVSTLGYQRKYSDAIEAIQWNLNGDSIGDKATGSYKFTETGIYKLSHALYGITGCITRDTVTIEVKPGFEEDYIPTLIRASIEQDSARVFWQGHPSASEYHVYRNGSLIAETTNTFYFEAYNHPAAIYQMSPLNVCQNHAPMSNPGQLIWLQASKEGNERADLNWNAYQEWDSGVGSYELEVYTKYLGDVSSTGYGLLSAFDSSLLSYEDADFFQEFASERCYRIKARGFKDEQWSYSNELCVPYDPLIFIPTAFSPNGDGLNDEFSAKCLGVKSYYLKIYNRWGEMVYQGLRWDGQYRGLSATQGIYIFYFEAMTTEGKLIYRSGTLTLLN